MLALFPKKLYQQDNQTGNRASTPKPGLWTGFRRLRAKTGISALPG